MFEVGTIVAGKYRIVGVLGRGGMGTVAAAVHVQLGTAVALKFLHEHMTHSPQVAERFMREAQAMAQLRSEHICKVFDVGVEARIPYIVMEKLEGSSLASLLKRRGRLAVPEACDLVLQACAGIGEAHAAAIVHRDLKPGNLFVTTRPDGSPLLKVLDFGIAKSHDDKNLEMTDSATILGSPSYMPLEQLRSSKLVDARADIWALGVILYELIAGRRPYSGEGLADIALKIAMEPAPPLADGPHPLDPVVTRCLQRDPKDRFQDVGELAFALAPFASEAGRALVPAIARVVGRALTGRVTTVVPLAEVPEPESPTTLRTGSGAIASQVPTIAKPSRRGLFAGLMAFAITSGGGVGYIASRSGGSETASPVTPRPAAQPAPPPVIAPEPPPARVEPPPVVEPEPEPKPEPLVEEPMPAIDARPRPTVKPPTPTPAKPRKRAPVEDIGKSRI